MAFVAVGAGVIALVTFVGHPVRRLKPSRSNRGYNACEHCHRPLPSEEGADWRLSGTCPRCGRVQEWAIRNLEGPTAAVEPWGPAAPAPRRPSQDRPVFRVVRIPAVPIRIGVQRAPERGGRSPSAPSAPSPGALRLPGGDRTNGRTPRVVPTRGVPAPTAPVRPRVVPAAGMPVRSAARAVPPRGVPVRGTPAAPLTPNRTTPGRTGSGMPAGAPARGAPAAPRALPATKERPPRVRESRDPMPVDPFVRVVADATRSMENVKGTRVHRPRPERVRGFRDRRRGGVIGRASTAPGQKGFNCCEDCGEPLPREHGREWRYAGTCPRCGHVQIWAV